MGALRYGFNRWVEFRCVRVQSGFALLFITKEFKTMIKKLAALCLCLLTACQGMPVDTTISACPVAGLESLTFYAGQPSDNASLAPESDDETPNIASWDFGGDAGNVFVRCLYTDGYENIQRLPHNMISCTVDYSADTKTASGLPLVEKLRCKAKN